jgi:hypothetical protein
MALTLERARKLLRYSKRTGKLRWRLNGPGKIIAGNEAGSKYEHDGVRYINVMVDGKHYLAHRLIWLIVKGVWPSRIDHRNLDGWNNRWTNLREASVSQNRANSRLPRTNTTGFKGIRRRGARWIACIYRGRKGTHLGTFDTPEQAHAAYMRAARRIHGGFARAA